MVWFGHLALHMLELGLLRHFTARDFMSKI